MTTYFDFKPSSTQAFQFSPVLDGVTYNAIITYNIFGQRYYLNLYTLQGVRILTYPMISSPPEYDISLVKGYFSSSLVYRGKDNRFEVTP